MTRSPSGASPLSEPSFRGAKRRSRRGAAGIAGFGTLAVFLATQLLNAPIGPYDECALLLGAKLTRAGWLPYRDFYTHYGPLGYGLAALLPDFGNAGLDYRAAQALALLAVALSLALITLRLASDGLSKWIGASGVLIGASSVLAQPQYLGWCGVIASIGLFTLSRAETRGPSSLRLLFGAGAGLAVTVLIRPAFALYAGAGLLCIELLTNRVTAAVRRVGTLLGAAAASLALIWMTAYRGIALRDAFQHMIVIPTRISTSAARFVHPFVVPGSPELLAASAVVAALFLAATSFAFAGTRRPIVIALVGGIGSGLVAPLTVFSTRPGFVRTVAVILLFAAAAMAACLERDALAPSPRLAASAACGLASIAFLHYFWSRPDISHFAPAIALAIAAAVLAAPELPSTFARATQTATVVAAALPMVFAWAPEAPPSRIFEARFPVRLSQDLPAAQISPHALAAVRLADAHADPGSRFVALASNHRRTELSAVVLFLLSKRLPYTGWYAYDPGIQDSERVQKLMLSDLRRSGSRTAVIWDAGQFVDVGGNDGPNPPAPTELDRVVLEDYPTVLGRFGSYEVRSRRE